MNQQIRKLFYTYRNGVVADALRSAGDPHELIFGLQLPQLGEIARNLRSSLTDEDARRIAKELWTEKNCRESRLLAPYLMNPEMLTKSEAERLLDDCRTHEETDILVFRCLRYITFAPEILRERSGTYDAIALGRYGV